MNWLDIISAIIQLVPVIIQLIKEIEAQIPGADQGAAKLQLLLDTLHAPMSVAPPPFQPNADFDKAVSNVVALWVKFFNSIGTFKTTLHA